MSYVSLPSHDHNHNHTRSTYTQISSQSHCTFVCCFSFWIAFWLHEKKSKKSNSSKQYIVLILSVCRHTVRLKAKNAKKRKRQLKTHKIQKRNRGGEFDFVTYSDATACQVRLTYISSYFLFFEKKDSTSKTIQRNEIPVAITLYVHIRTHCEW